MLLILTAQSNAASLLGVSGASPSANRPLAL